MLTLVMSLYHLLHKELRTIHFNMNKSVWEEQFISLVIQQHTIKRKYNYNCTDNRNMIQLINWRENLHPKHFGELNLADTENAVTSVGLQNIN
jgi:hypothetical protein